MLSAGAAGGRQPRRFRDGEWIEVESRAVVRGLPSSRKYATEFASVVGEDPGAGTVEIRLPREKGTHKVGYEEIRPGGSGAGGREIS